MIDIVIPLGKSKTDFLDLRYALRSIEAFTPNVNVYIVGEKPKWLTNYIWIPFKDAPEKHWKERNIYLKVKEAFKYTDRFVMMNDDHVFLQTINLETYPNYYKGTCYQSMLKNASHYRQTMNQTKKWLEAKGYPDLNYDGHCPLIMEREQFDKTVDTLDWTAKFGYGMKSIYCAGLEGEYMQDVKMSKQLTYQEAANKCEGRHVISFMDGALKTGLGEYLNTILPYKSKYEQ